MAEPAGVHVDVPTPHQTDEWDSSSPCISVLPEISLMTRHTIEIGFSIHDSTYTTDYLVWHVHFEDAKVNPKTISDFIITSITAFSNGE